MRVAQMKKSSGLPVRQKIRCECFTTVAASEAGDFVPIKRKRSKYTHDPADGREGKTKMTNCGIYYNLTRVQGSALDWTINIGPTLKSTQHNHPPHPVRVPKAASQAQKAFAKDLLAATSLDSAQLRALLLREDEDHALNPKQVSNLIQMLKRKDLLPSKLSGSEAATLIDNLNQRQRDEPGWEYSVMADAETNQLLAVFWQSPRMAALGRRYGDVVIDDIAALRNDKAMPLNIFSTIDQYYQTQSVAYCLQISESAEFHLWAINRLFESTLIVPSVFCSDWDTALCSVMEQHYPQVFHLLCLHHLAGNLPRNLKGKLGSNWHPFMQDFWKAYYSASEADFDRRFELLMRAFPESRSYLANELLDRKEQWAAYSVAARFTAGLRTNGRVENESKQTKRRDDAKTSIIKLFQGLDARDKVQADRETNERRLVRSSFGSASNPS